jgi:hypothetical protein
MATSPRTILRWAFIATALLVAAWIALKLAIPNRIDLPPVATLGDSAKSMYLAFLRDSGSPPAEYVTSRFRKYDVVILGEFHRIRHDPLFVAGLIPRLHASGVNLLGYEFACPEDQDRVDRLLTGDSFDEPLAISIQRNLGGGFWPYQEYLEVFRSAWALNAGLPDGREKFRILPMTAFVDGAKLREGTPEERLEQEKRLYFTDSLIADIVEREALAKGKKILVYCGIHHGFSKFRQPRFDDDALTCLGGFSEKRGGQRIYARHPEKVVTLVLHAPHIDLSFRTFTLPWNGVIDRAFEGSGRPVGFDVAGSPFAALTETTTVYACGRGSVSLEEFCDGYIILDQIPNYQPVTMNPRWFDGISFSDFKKGLIRDLPFFIFHPKIFTWLLEEEGNPVKGFSELRRQLDGSLEGRKP